MRSNSRQRQDVYFSEIKETLDEIDTVQEYTKPVIQRMTVASTSGTPEEISAGIVPTYDRYLIFWKSRWNKFKPKEGWVLWIDVAPELNEDGDLLLDDNGLPTVLPDYRLDKIIDTKKGAIARYGIVKIGGHDGEED